MDSQAWHIELQRLPLVPVWWFTSGDVGQELWNRNSKVSCKAQFDFFSFCRHHRGCIKQQCVCEAKANLCYYVLFTHWRRCPVVSGGDLSALQDNQTEAWKVYLLPDQQCWIQLLQDAHTHRYANTRTHILRLVGRRTRTRAWMIRQPVLTNVFVFFPPGNHRPIYMFHKGPAQKKWSDRKQCVHDRKWDFALPLCMLSAREKGVDCFFTVPTVNLHFIDLQAWEVSWHHGELYNQSGFTVNVYASCDVWSWTHEWPQMCSFSKYDWIIWL